MANPNAIRELRLINTGTTFNTQHVSANAAAWNITNTVQLRIQSWDATDLKYESQPDGTLQSRLHGAPYHIPTLRKGGVKFKCYLPTADNAVTIDPVANVLSAIMGGTVIAPTSRTLLCGTGSNATHINMQTAHGISNGMAILFGVKGDGAGGGEVRSILSTVNANTVILNMALQAAPVDGSLAVCSHTIFLDEDQAQTYFDGLAIGKETDDAQQFVGAMGPFKISGTGPGDLPSVDIELQCADWQFVQGITRSGTVPAGNKPPTNRGLGGFFVGDSQTTVAPVARGVMKVADIDIDPGLKYEALPDPNGVNGIGGWVRMQSSPSLKFSSIYSEDMPGLYNDWTTPTAKQIIVQFGAAQQGCCAVEFQRYWLNTSPVPKAIGGLAGVEIDGHGDEGQANTNGDRERSSIRIHVF